jgi:hypothetical protein
MAWRDLASSDTLMSVGIYQVMDWGWFDFFDISGIFEIGGHYELEEMACNVILAC